MRAIDRLLKRWGYVKLDEFGLAVTEDERIIATRPAILDDGLGARIVGWRDGDLAAMELQAWQPATFASGSQSSMPRPSWPARPPATNASAAPPAPPASAPRASRTTDAPPASAPRSSRTTDAPPPPARASRTTDAPPASAPRPSGTTDAPPHVPVAIAPAPSAGIPSIAQMIVPPAPSSAVPVAIAPAPSAQLAPQLFTMTRPPAPAAAAPPEPEAKEEDEWEWEIAMARARAAAEWIEQEAATVAMPTRPRAAPIAPRTIPERGDFVMRFDDETRQVRPPAATTHTVIPVPQLPSADRASVMRTLPLPTGRHVVPRRLARR